MALKNGSIDIALGMFKYLKELDQPIRQHYFWPIFIAKNKLNDLQGNYFFYIYINFCRVKKNLNLNNFYQFFYCRIKRCAEYYD